MPKYDAKSSIAEEFINDAEIQESLAYAEQNKNNREVVRAILEKARQMKGRTNREAVVLLDSVQEEENREIAEPAHEIKDRIYR